MSPPSGFPTRPPATTGEFKAFDPPTKAVVRALALSSNAATLYLGGDCTTVGAQGRTRVAAVNGTTGALTTGFTANVGNHSVLALAAEATHLSVGGSFTGFGAQPTGPGTTP